MLVVSDVYFNALLVSCWLIYPNRWTHELKTINKVHMITKHAYEGHIFFHIVWDWIYIIHLLFFTFFICEGMISRYLTNLRCIIKWLSQPFSLWKITGLSVSWKFRLQFWWLDPRFFFSDITMVSNTNIYITNVALFSFLEVFFIFMRHL